MTIRQKWLHDFCSCNGKCSLDRLFCMCWTNMACCTIFIVCKKRKSLDFLTSGSAAYLWTPVAPAVQQIFRVQTESMVHNPSRQVMSHKEGLSVYNYEICQDLSILARNVKESITICIHTSNTMIRTFCLCYQGRRTSSITHVIHHTIGNPWFYHSGEQGRS